MATRLVEFPLEDGSGSVLVQVTDTEPGYTRAAAGDTVEKAAKTFEHALSVIRTTAIAVLAQVGSIESEDAHLAEVEVDFGVTLTGKLGLGAIASAEAEGTFHVKLKWTRA